jgi:hypothetical protein
MSKIFNKYLSFLGILLFTSGMNLHANTVVEDIQANSNLTSVNTELSNFTFNSSKHKSETKFLFETTEIQEIENEEYSGEDNSLVFVAHSSSFLNAKVFNKLSFLSQTFLYHYKNYFDKSTTKLHVRLQVFII